MKTQHRHPATMSVYATIRHLHADRARWKRKNRVKQLKRTIERYKYGTMLDGQFDLYIAYKWLQRLKMPSKDADSRSWLDYLYKLRSIRGVVVSAMIEAEEVLKKALERENRKEQP